MNVPPYQWRAEVGYLEGPPPQPQQPPATLFFQANQPFYQYLQPQILVPGPVGIYGIATPTHAQPQPERQPGPAPKKIVSFPPSPPKPESEKGSDKSGSKKSDDGSKKDDKPKTTRHAPPPLMPGTNYMYSTEDTLLHIFNRGKKLWEPKYRDQWPLRYKIFQVDTQKTVRALIEYVVGSKPSDGPEKCKGWAATEMIEVGDSIWNKGTTVEYESDRSKGTMAQMGWTARRGKELPPVWMAIHKV